MTRESVEGAINRFALLLAKSFTGLLVAFLGAILALTILGPLLAVRAPAASAAIHTAFRFSCHQIPDRCLSIGPGRAPVCARCQAIYAGTFLASLASLAWRRVKPLPAWGLIPMLLPCAVDGVTQLTGLRTSTATLRILTGFPVGVGIALFAVPLVRQGMLEAAADVRRTLRPNAPSGLRQRVP